MFESRLIRTCVVLVLLGAIALFIAQHRDPPQTEVAEFDPTASGRLPALDLDLGEHSLTGRVVDHLGAAAAGIYLTAMHGDWLVHDVTDEEGRFAFNSLHEGQLEILAVRKVLPHGSHLADVPASGEITIRLPEPLAEVPSLPRIERRTLDGRLKLAFGAAPDGYEVVLLPTVPTESGGSRVDSSPGLSGAVLRRASADANGRFLFETLVLGDYLAVVLPPWAAGGSWPELVARPIRHSRESGMLELSTQSGALVGRVFDDRGEPVPEALIEVHDGERAGRVWAPAATQNDGTFRVPDLPAGSYRVHVSAGQARFERLVRVSALREVNVAVDALDLNTDD